MEKVRLLNSFHKVKWFWVKGHDGNFGNEKQTCLQIKQLN